MLDIGWSELLVLAIVAIVVIGPKDLPKLMRTIGFYAGKARRAAADFQRQFNEVVAESEADEVRKNLEAIRSNMGPAPDLSQPIGKPLMTGPTAPVQSDFVAPPQSDVTEPPLPAPPGTMAEPQTAETPVEAPAKRKRAPAKKTAAKKTAAKKTAAKAAPAKKTAAKKKAPAKSKPRTAKQAETPAASDGAARSRTINDGSKP